MQIAGTTLGRRPPSAGRCSSTPIEQRSPRFDELMTAELAFRGSTQRPAVLDHTAGQAQPAGLGQRGITVGHEGLR